MKLEFAVFGITLFFIYNTYCDGKYTKMLYDYKKYYKMGFYMLIGIGIYLILKRNPQQGRNMLQNANNMIKYLPIDKETRHFINPILDFTSTPSAPADNSRLIQSGKNTTKRCVSETKKKYVASRQNWKCEMCDSQLDHTFEIDPKVRLEYGGDNNVENLVALCRNCHGQKTANENM